MLNDRALGDPQPSNSRRRMQAARELCFKARRVYVVPAQRDEKAVPLKSASWNKRPIVMNTYMWICATKWLYWTGRRLL